ncbi:hypothetical protein SARC_15027 [Sphaeroforma arctica JP610]|uniref:Protein kinase domain-containing protein n=1 Tax=Sphaeroforma arctica JP610 TaxID=667725 RepID=A0A0L0F6S0_9EUKA|nr:hypothetical protein SARC_15027 [Sphaeroforma arctica JP610]KNC72415.1 hypothetical protein SARC_15027 [Sphaeroforma arctica JP610]|eukprot:XP_014146317.1 hypothetical protein SARC_15027 [Sphaeroforma arctica JP610]
MMRTAISKNNSNSIENVAFILDEDGLIDFADIEIKETLGSGNFGRVYKADYLGTDVAVKEVCIFAES